MQTVTKTFFGDVKIGQAFLMFDIFMVKSDVADAVALGHIDCFGFHQVYFDDLKSSGMTPFKIQPGVPVSVIDLDNVKNYTDAEFKIENLEGDLTHLPFNAVFIFNGKAYLRISHEENFSCYLPISSIVEIENDGEYGVLDHPESLFVRNEKSNTWLWIYSNI